MNTTFEQFSCCIDNNVLPLNSIHKIPEGTIITLKYVIIRTDDVILFKGNFEDGREDTFKIQKNVTWHLKIGKATVN